MVAPTVLEEVRLYLGSAGRDRRTARIVRPGDATARRCLAACAAEHLAAKHPAELSPGELRRVALARGLARIEAGARVLLLDEPTAHLDRDSATAVSGAIAALRGKVTVLLVAHDRQTRELADDIVAVAPGRGGEPRVEATADAIAARAAGTGTSTAAGPPLKPRRWNPGRPQPSSPDSSRPDSSSPDGRQPRTRRRRRRGAGRDGRRHLRRFNGSPAPPAARTGRSQVRRGRRRRHPGGALRRRPGRALRLADHPRQRAAAHPVPAHRDRGRALLRHRPGRLRYLERLLLHDAVFAALTRLRGRLWESLSRRALSLRRLLQGGNVLGTVVDDVDTVRELLPRVVLPPLTAVAVAAAAVTGIALLLPAALPAVIAAAVLSLVAAPALALAADRMSAGTEQRLRSGVLRQVAAALDARAELHANGVAAPVLAAITRADRSATAASQRSAWAEGLGQGLTVLACGTAALASAVLAAPLALSGAVEASTVAVVVLLQLALVEPYAAITTAVRQYPALRAVLARIGEAGVLDDADGDGDASGGLVPVAGRPGGRPGIELRDLAAAWPGGPPVFTGLTATAEPGRWLAVTGTSGSGKSTLLAVVLGFLPAAGGQILLGGRAAWCPQEAHLFDSTIRGNLLLGLPESQRGEEPEPRLQDALDAVGLGPLMGRLEHGLDTRIGPGGAFLSGGERQRLAVARTLLTGADVILLDEPTAHLDAESGRAMLAELRHGLRDRTVVLVTHNPEDIAADDSRLDLDRAAAVNAAPSQESTPLLARG